MQPWLACLVTLLGTWIGVAAVTVMVGKLRGVLAGVAIFTGLPGDFLAGVVAFTGLPGDFYGTFGRCYNLIRSSRRSIRSFNFLPSGRDILNDNTNSRSPLGNCVGFPLDRRGGILHLDRDTRSPFLRDEQSFRTVSMTGVEHFHESAVLGSLGRGRGKAASLSWSNLTFHRLCLGVCRLRGFPCVPSDNLRPQSLLRRGRFASGSRSFASSCQNFDCTAWRLANF